MTSTRATVRWWAIAFACLGAALVARNLFALDTAPPGMYVDEASIGYNAWAVAQHGVDEHGARLPLYFEAFGESKNPVYIYSLAALLRVLPLTPFTERIPAALFGAVCVLFLTLAAWRLSRSRLVAMCVFAFAALTPWLIQESRVGFEVISMVAALCIALWCLADEQRVSRGRFIAAGCFLAISIVAYSTGRLVVALFAIAFLLTYGRLRQRGWWLTLLPIAGGYALVGVWALLHPGALTAEFSVINIGTDGAPPLTLVARFVSNYAQYFSPDFLFIHGDPNPRHNTGYAGMLLVATAPLVLLGLWECWRRRAGSLPRFLVLCLVLAPIPAALTNSGGSGHALRGAAMLPYFMLIAALGASRLFALARLRVAAVVVGAGLLAQAGLYTADLYTDYPVRAAAAFDTGALAAVQLAGQSAHGHTVRLSSSLNEQPYIDAFFTLLPPPPSAPVHDSADRGLKQLGFVVADPLMAETEAQPGDILVLSEGDPKPAVPLQLIATERAPRDAISGSGGYPLLEVYRVL